MPRAIPPPREVTNRNGPVSEDEANGQDGPLVLTKAVEGPITSMISATALQLHARCTVVVDEPAAGKLQAADYHRWILWTLTTGSGQWTLPRRENERRL